MADWDGVNKAPKGKFRVIGTDTFSWPHEDYWAGDYADLAQAKKLAESRVQRMECLAVYDESGKVLFVPGADAPKV